MIRWSGHDCSRSIFPDELVFGITELPISPETEIGSRTFCPDLQDFRIIGARINESSLYMFSCEAKATQSQ